MKFLKKLDHIYSARTINNFAQLKNSYNNVQTLCADPFIGIIDNVLDEYETNYYIDFFQGSQRNGYSIEAMIDSELTGNYINANRQQRKNYNINHKDTVDTIIRNRISKICCIPETHCEKTILGKYIAGEKLEEHHDAVNFLSDSNLFSFLLSGGQRIMTAIAYLNDTQSGGETYFPDQQISITPKKGRVLLFHNVGSNANIPHRRSSHKSLLLDEGEKYIATFWFRISTIDWNLYDAVSNYDLTRRKELYKDLCNCLHNCKQTIEFID